MLAVEGLVVSLVSPLDGGLSAARVANIRDVAHLAGVSPGTVSKVMNGRAGPSQATRARVELAIQQLGYRPNELVRAIFGRRTYTVGLLTSDSFGRFSSRVMAGAEDALDSGRISVIMCDSRGDSEREDRLLSTLLGRRIDGLIVTGRCSNPRPPVRGPLPFPVVYAHTPSTDAQDCSVVVDDFGAGVVAANHLVDAGRRRIAHITGPSDFDAVQLRAQGLETALKSHKLAVYGGVRMGDWSEAWGRQAARSLVAELPDVDGIYCGSDLLARGVSDALLQLRRHVPEDIAIVGTDNWQLIARAVRPPLTTVDMQLDQVGRVAAEFLLEAIDGNPVDGTRVISPNLVLRASSGFPYNDPAADAPSDYHTFCIHNPQ